MKQQVQKFGRFFWAAWCCQTSVLWSHGIFHRDLFAGRIACEKAGQSAEKQDSDRLWDALWQFFSRNSRNLKQRHSVWRADTAWTCRRGRGRKINLLPPRRQLGTGTRSTHCMLVFWKRRRAFKRPPKTCTRPRYHRKSGREIEREVQGMQPTRSFREARSHHPCRRTFVEKRIHQRNAFTGWEFFRLSWKYACHCP